MPQKTNVLESEFGQKNENVEGDMAAECIKFRSIAENAPVILWLTDTGGTVNFFNQKWLEFTGLTADQMSAETWVNALHPDDRDKCLKKFDTAFKNQTPVELEYRLKRHDGVFRTMVDTGKPLWEKGKLLGYVGCAVDITELKETADELHESHVELRAHANETLLLREMNEYLQVCHSVEETYPIVNYYVERLFNHESGALCIINDSRSIVETRARWGEDLCCQELFTPDDCWALRKGKIHYVAEGRKGLVCNHLSADDRSAYLCVPMIAQGEVMGVLHLKIPTDNLNHSKARTDHIIDTRKELACTAAENLALALASLKLREALRFQSIRDPLTQLFNRRYMLETLERELCRAKRNNTSVGLIMMDVDHFKRFNDNHGHDVGDAVLSELGRFLNAQIRGEDIACRYGGEELILVLPDASLESVMVRAQQMREDIAEIKLDYKNKPVGSITVSMGVSAFPDHGADSETLINTADNALYRAKHEGRNRVISADTNDIENA